MRTISDNRILSIVKIYGKYIMSICGTDSVLLLKNTEMKISFTEYVLSSVLSQIINLKHILYGI